MTGQYELYSRQQERQALEESLDRQREKDAQQRAESARKRIPKMLECQKYLNKPVPEEAEDSQQFFAGEKIFILGLFRFLVNDENIVTFAYKKSQEPQSLDNR